MLHDLTELRSSSGSALQAERLAAVGQMAAGLAHESRNALQRSQACLALLALRLQGQQDCLDLLGRIEKAQDDLHHLFEDVRSYAVAPRLQRRWYDLRQIWREAWSELDNLPAVARPPCWKRISTASIALPGGPVLSQASRSQPAGKRPCVRSKPGPRHHPLPSRRTLRAEEAICILSLRDNGPGIPAEMRPRLVRAVFHHQSSGTGLGLAICKRIIEAHGGHIRGNSGFRG